MSLAPRFNIVSRTVQRDHTQTYASFLKALAQREPALSHVSPRGDDLTYNDEWTCFPVFEVVDKDTEQPIEEINVAIRPHLGFQHCMVTACSEPDTFRSTDEAAIRTEAMKAISKAAFRACGGAAGYNTLNNISPEQPRSFPDAVYALRFADFLMIDRSLRAQWIKPDWDTTLRRDLIRDFFEERDDNDITTLCLNECPFGFSGGRKPKALASIFFNPPTPF